MSVTSRSSSESWSLASLSVGDRVPAIEKTATRVQITLYCSAIRFAHQVHFDDDLCRKQGWRGVIVPGFLMGNWCLEAVTSALGPSAVVQRTSFRMTSVAYPGEVQSVSGEVTELARSGDEITVTCQMAVTDASGVIVTKGSVTATALCPPPL